MWVSYREQRERAERVLEDGGESCWTSLKLLEINEVMKLKNLLICVVFISLISLLILSQCQNRNHPSGAKTNPVSDAEKQSPLVDASKKTLPEQDDSEFLDNVQKAITVQNRFNSKFEFYGLVVDQDGAPVEGATVRMQTTKYKRAIGLKIDYTHEDFIKKSEVVYTDSSGQFEFSDGYGSSLLIEEITKDGYLPARGKKNISFLSTSGARHQPNASEPVVYTMWKREEAEPLIKEEFRFKFYNGNPPQGISFVQGQWTKSNIANADLIISANMGEPNPEQRNQYDWKVILTPVNGGLVKTDDIFPYEAPDSGYKDTYSFSQIMTDSDWVSSIPDLSFYVKAQNGKIYANMAIDFNTHPSGRFFVVVKILANPNSSRNLEYDPDLRIEP